MSDLQYKLQGGATVAVGDLVEATKDDERHRGRVLLYNGIHYIGERGQSLRSYESLNWTIDVIEHTAVEEPAKKSWRVRFVDRNASGPFGELVTAEKYSVRPDWVTFFDADGKVVVQFADRAILSIQRVTADV